MSDRVEERLEQLEAESRRREAALSALADEVPSAVSRTALVRAMVRGAPWRRRGRS